MKSLRYTSIVIILFVIFAGCQSQVERAANSITGESLLNHIEILSSDEFEGRAPATRGEELTVTYLIEQLKSTFFN